jgi:hypothetical protein
MGQWQRRFVQLQVRRGKSDFSTNTGWTLDWPGQAGKFVKGKR